MGCRDQISCGRSVKVRETDRLEMVEGGGGGEMYTRILATHDKCPLLRLSLCLYTADMCWGGGRGRGGGGAGRQVVDHMEQKKMDR